MFQVYSPYKWSLSFTHHLFCFVFVFCCCCCCCCCFSLTLDENASHKNTRVSWETGSLPITMKIEDDCRRPNLSDRKRIRADTTGPLGETSPVSFKKSDLRSSRRGDNETVMVLSKGQLPILKMAAVRPYLLTDQNRFRADISKHREEFICHVLTSFGGDAITVKIKDGCRRPHLLTNRIHFRAGTTRLLLGNISDNFRKINPSSGLEEDAITRKKNTD